MKIVEYNPNAIKIANIVPRRKVPLYKKEFNSVEDVLKSVPRRNKAHFRLYELLKKYPLNYRVNTEGNTYATLGKPVVNLNGRDIIIRNEDTLETMYKIKCNCGEQLPMEFRNYMDGLLLGDGSIKKSDDDSRISTAYEHMSINKPFLEEIKKFFEKYEIHSSIYMIEKLNEHKLYTSAIPEFNWFRDRWYKEKENVSDDERFKYDKVLPHNLKLTPQCVANWYMGDGSLIRHREKYHAIKLSTHSFSSEEVTTLANTLNTMLNLNFKVYKETVYTNDSINRTKDYYYTLRLNNDTQTKTFLDYIKNYITDTFSYKYIPFYEEYGVN